MSDPYQRGSDEEWLEHSNAELSQIIKKRNRSIFLWKFVALILLMALIWTVFKYGQDNRLGDLFQW
jgi:hypothetical protein